SHLGLKETVCIGCLRALERVGADQFGQAIRLVRRCSADGAHLMEHHVVRALGELIGGFGPGETATNDMDRSHGRITPLALVLPLSPAPLAPPTHCRTSCTCDSRRA